MQRLVRGNKICYNHEIDRQAQIHQKKLNGMASLVRTQADIPIQNQNKKYYLDNMRFQLLEDKYTEIERENRILLEKIQKVAVPERSRARSFVKQSLNSTNRKQNLVRITIENQQMMQRLKNPKASYDTRHILKSTQKHVQLVQQISDFNQSKRLKGKSGRQKSEDLSQSKKVMLYLGNHKFGDKCYFIQIWTQDNIFKITADESSIDVTKILEMPIEDGTVVLSEIFNNDIKQMANAIEITDKIHIKGLEDYEEF